MMSSLKRNSIKNMEMLTPLEHQHFQRLKVNRVAVLQELKVDHVLQQLQINSVLDQDDIRYILAGKSMTEKSKRLLDLLPTKGRKSNWYNHFRSALLNPAVDDMAIKLKYQNLVEFLDNTLIEQLHSPTRSRLNGSVSPRSKYTPLPSINRNASMPPTNTKYSRKESVDKMELQPSVKQKESTYTVSTKDRSMSTQPTSVPKRWNIESLKGSLIPYSIEQWENSLPDDFTLLCELPAKNIKDLKSSPHTVDHDLATQEELVYNNVKQLEIAFYLWKQQELAEETVFCTCSPVLEIIQNPQDHHLYLKYFHHLQNEFDIDILTEIANSFDEITQWLACDNDLPTLNHLINIGLNLIDFSSKYGNWDLAKQLHTSILSYLANHEGLEILLPLFKVYVRGMTLYNDLCDFTETDKFYRQALALKEQISLVSFGQDILDCSQLFIQTSVMMRELGSYGPAYTWSQKAMQEVELENNEDVISVLCNASVAYAIQWKILRAEDLAVEAVQQAKKLFGIHHPLYLKALLNFVRFSSQYRKDMSAVETANTAVKITHKLYGYDCLQLAEALAAQAMALVEAQRIEDGLYIRLAEKAYHMAVENLPLHHPLIIPYIETLARCLICKAQTDKTQEIKAKTLAWAEGETKSMLSICHKLFGEINPKTAKALLVLAEVYTSGGRLKEAEDCLILAEKRLSLCLGLNHGSVHQAKAKLGNLYFLSNDTAKAIQYLKDVVDHFDPGAYYLPWYNQGHRLLVDCYEKQGEVNLAKEYRSKYLGWKWTSEDNRRKISWRELHAMPESYDSFLEKFELWRSKIQKLQDHMGRLKISQSIKNQ